MPRIRNWKDLKFYCVDKTHEYKHIDSLFSDVVDWKLNNYSHKNKLYQAFRELGRVIRAIFLLKYC